MKRKIVMMGDQALASEFLDGKRPMPFHGELMTCCICGAQEQSAPGLETNWRAITVEDRTIYACPNEFPPDGSPAEAYQAAYVKILRKTGKPQ